MKDVHDRIVTVPQLTQSDLICHSYTISITFHVIVCLWDLQLLFNHQTCFKPPFKLVSKSKTCGHSVLATLLLTFVVDKDVNKVIQGKYPRFTLQ